MSIPITYKFKVNVCSWNANGVNDKQDELTDFLCRRDIDILLLNETKLTDTDTLDIDEYTTYRRDRLTDGVPQGGVAILVRSHIPHRHMTEDRQTSIETITLYVNKSFYISACYNRPSNTISQQDLDYLLRRNRTLLVGDFNARHRTWGKQVPNRNGKIIYDYSSSQDVVLAYPDRPTHFPANGSKPTTIDLAINRHVHNTTDPISLDDLGSDHNPILFTIHRVNTHKTLKQYTSFKHTDWVAFRHTIDSHTTLNNNIHTIKQLEQEVHNFTHTLQLAKVKHTKLITHNTHTDPLPGYVRDLMTDRNRTRKLWQRTQHPAYREHMNTLTRTIRWHIKQDNNTTLERKLLSLSTKDNFLWKITKITQKPHKPIPNLVVGATYHITDCDRRCT